MTTWPAHGWEALPWRQQQRAGSRADRQFDTVDASVPPTIVGLDYLPSFATTVACETALLTVATADADSEGNSAALARFMIRSESVASSKIERIQADAVDYARALAGGRSNASATSMVAASTALHSLVERVGVRGVFEPEDVMHAHRALMHEDPAEREYAGRLRDMQNWIGGSDFSPRAALYVPPAPERVPDLIDDLIGYLNRDDVPALTQAAIAHAQFESIHPFTDGNGRIGRALVSASLRRRGVTRSTVIPLASGILARRDDYFAALSAYRAGDPEPIIVLFATSARVAASEARVSITRITALPVAWNEEVRARRGSAAAALLRAFSDNPVLSSVEVERSSGAGATQTYSAIGRLEEAGIVREITGRKRDRVWAATELMAELDDLDRRIAAGMRS